MARIDVEFPRFKAPNGGIVPVVPGRDTATGYASLIGDGVYLSAAHIPYEYYRATGTDETVVSGSRNASITIGGGKASILSDFRGYYSAATAAGNTDNSSKPYIKAETQPSVVSKDIILLAKSDNLSANGSGLATYLQASDMLDLKEMGFVVKRAVTSRAGDITSVDRSTFGTGVFQFSRKAQEGDSGDAYTIKLDSKNYIFGVQSSTFAVNGVPSGDAIGNYFTPDEFTFINELLERRQTEVGNITKSEPTNLIFGSKAADTALIARISCLGAAAMICWTMAMARAKKSMPMTGCLAARAMMC
jgi:hypothetical protein